MSEETRTHEKKETSSIVTEDGLLDISGYVDTGIKCIKHHWILFVTILSILSTVGWIISGLSYKPVYSTYTTFAVTTGENYGSSQSYYNNSTATQIAKTFPYIISTSAMQYLVADELGMKSVPGSVSASVLENTNFVTIRTSADSPQIAYDILQAVIDNYKTVAEKVIGDTSMTVIEEGGIPTRASNANDNTRAAKMGFLLGAAICAAYIVFYVMGRKTIRKEEELKTQLNMRCLASIPKVQFKKSRTAKKKLILLDNPAVPGSFKEGCRTTRARMERTMKEKGSKVFLVTSASANEGKTTVAANLAMAMAERGYKTIILDGDLRNPSTGAAFGMRDKHSGMIDILAGRSYLMDTIVQYKELPLYIIPGGRSVNMTAKYLESEQANLLFELLRKDYDCIIIDTPPSGLLSDAALIAKYADEGIFVVRQDYSAVDRVKEGIELLLDAKDLHMTGSILNYVENGLGSGYNKYSKYSYS